MWKNKLRYADYLRRVPEARGNIEQRDAATIGQRRTCERAMCIDRQRKNPFKSSKHRRQRERNLLCRCRMAQSFVKVDFHLRKVLSGIQINNNLTSAWSLENLIKSDCLFSCENVLYMNYCEIFLCQTYNMCSENFPIILQFHMFHKKNWKEI